MDANLSSPVPDLNEKTVFITGGASGMGKNIAAGVLEKGGRVVVLDISEDNIAVAVKDLGEEHRVAFYLGSVEKKSDVAAAFALAAERFGTVHHQQCPLAPNRISARRRTGEDDIADRRYRPG